MIERIVSGGQTGVDRAALDVSLELGIPCGGWCPKGRKAEDGVIPEKYRLLETPTDRYSERTERNVKSTDGTLILSGGKPSSGSKLTLKLADKHRKPCLVVDLTASPDLEAVGRWVDAEGIKRLNVAGPRESETAGIYDRASSFLRESLAVAR